VFICADPQNLVTNSWSGWLEVFLERLCPRNDWSQIKSDFILDLQSDMTIAARENIWFKFKLIFCGSRLSQIEPPKYIKETKKIISIDGTKCGYLTNDVELNLKVYSQFSSEFVCEPLSTLQGSDVQKCFCHFLFPIPEELPFEDSPLHENCTTNSDSDRPDWCICGQDNCICRIGRND